MILDGPYTMRRMLQEIRGGHFAAGHKGGNGSKCPQRDQQAAKELDNSGSQHKWYVNHRGAAQNAKKLLRPVAGKQETSYQSHQTVELVRESFQELHRLTSLSLEVSLPYEAAAYPREVRSARKSHMCFYISGSKSLEFLRDTDI